MIKHRKFLFLTYVNYQWIFPMPYSEGSRTISYTDNRNPRKSLIFYQVTASLSLAFFY